MSEHISPLSYDPSITVTCYAVSNQFEPSSVSLLKEITDVVPPLLKEICEIIGPNIKNVYGEQSQSLISY